MHIPDNFLSTPVWASLDAAAIPAVAIVSRQAHRATDTNRLPLLGVMGAFVFAAQMINFPVGLGTSGHLVGGTLLAYLLGPWAAALVVTAILIVQALIFQDGGVLALGANIINMALLGVLAGYLPARWFLNSRWKSAGIFLGGTCSVLVSGVLALSELLLSGIRMPSALIGVSLAVFAVNAVLEGAITLSVLRAIDKLNPAFTGAAIHETHLAAEVKPLLPRLVSGAALASLIFAVAGIWMASKLPDGLEDLAQKLGLPLGAQRLFQFPLGDYQIAGFGGTWFSRASAGLVGLAIIYLVCALGTHLIARGRRSYS